jgi:acetolactate synthase-1/2/3 large subunit
VRWPTARAADGGAAAVADCRRQRLGRRGGGALQRFAEAWQLPVACAFRFQDTFDNRHPLYAGDVGIGINPKLAERMCAVPTWSSRWACAWAR